jgi:hypothetical protein
MQLDPLEANGFAHLLGRALRAGGLYQDAATAYKQVRRLRYQHCAELAACYAEMGIDQETAKQKVETLRLNPDFSIETYLKSLPYREAGDREQLRDSLKKSGLPG